MKMKVYELTLEDGAEGVFAISLVDRPAIGENFIAFSKANKIEFKDVPNEGNTLVGAVLIPDLLIDRMGNDGEMFQVYLSGETIKQTAHNYLKRGLQSASTLQHKADINGVTVVETWLKEDEVKDKSLMYGFDLPVNTWFVKMSVDNPEIKEQIKNGTIKGFSIEGLFEQKLELSKLNINESMKYKKPLNKIMAALSLEVKLEQVKLLDGVTVLEAESFEAGYSIGIVTDSGIIPAPAGEYETADGKVITIVTDGVIEKIEDAATEEAAETPEEEIAEVPMSAEPTASTPKKIVDTVTKETFFEEVKKEIEELEVKFSEEKKLLESEIEKLKLELSEAAAKPIAFNPEKKGEVKEMTRFEAYKALREKDKNNK